MKKYFLAAGVCFAGLTAFSQSKNPAINDAAKDPKRAEMSAIADTMLINKKSIVDEKKKKPRQKSSHKECSRMKS